MSDRKEHVRQTGGRPPRNVRMKGAGAKDAKGTIKRLMGYLAPYKGRLILVIFLILVSSISGAASSLFLGVLIDDFIEPLTHMAHPVFTQLARVLGIMAVVYLAGILATLFQNRIMVVVAQGVLKKVRDEMFAHMQKLPIRYFDTNHFGDIMSRYTNDTDTLRQLMAQTLVQLFSSGTTIVVVLASMIYLSIPLTVLVLVIVFFMLRLTGTIGGKAGGFFVKQQKSLGAVNGYIEEMVSGQKVIKVFNHEEKTKEDFDKLNEELRENAANANILANILMPIMGNLGNLMYVIVAIVGGALAISGISAGLTLGAIAAFLQLTRSFVMPVNQVAQQINAVAMARHSHRIDLLGHLVHRHHETPGQLQEGRDGSQGQPGGDAADGQRTAYDRHDHVHQIPQIAHDGHEDIGQNIRVGRIFSQFFIELIEIFLGLLFVIEDFDDLLSGDHFLDISIHCSQRLLLLHEEAAGFAADSPRQPEHEENDHQHQHRQRDAQVDHRRQHHHDGGPGGEQLDQRLGHQLPQGIRIVGVAAHDIAEMIRIKIPDRELLHVGKHLVPDFFQHALGHHDHDPVLEQGRQDPRQVNHRHDPQHPRQLGEDRVGHMGQRFDEIVDQHPQEEGAGRAADGADQDQEDHQDQPSFVRG